MDLDLDRRTLAYRLNHGWTVDQALGFTPRLRDRTAEQAASAEAHARVLVTDGDRVVPRREAAQRLGIKVTSLTHRLRRYRPADGSTARVPLASLLAR
jgi:DNA-binding GntR family transcriptional regulator